MNKIISISGFDGAGKTTQLQLLRNTFIDRGLKTASIFDIKNDEHYANVGELDEYKEYFSSADVVFTRFYLRSAKTVSLQNYVMFNDDTVFEDFETVYELFTSAKHDAKLWFEVVINWLCEEDKIIIFDRYYHDEVAYRSLYSLDFKELLTEYTGTIFEPVISFYLKLPIENIINRNETRDDKNTILFNSPKKLEQLFSNYERLTKDTALTVIDGTENIELIHEKIMRTVDNMV